MYIQKTLTGYDKEGTQVAWRALFLILVHRQTRWEEDKPVFGEETRAIVRKVALRQLGHFMMGSARVKGKSLTISGSYGGDGNGIQVSDDIFDAAVPLPPDLVDAWNKGEGWNGAGAEACAMRTWALANLDRLYPPSARESARKIRRESVKVPTSRMSFKRAMATVRSFCASLRDVHSRARTSGRTAEEMREDIARATYGRPEWKRLPTWAKSEVTGYGRALSDEDYSSHLEWKVSYRGAHVNGADVPPGGWSEVDGKSGCHFWKATGKAFGPIETTVSA